MKKLTILLITAIIFFSCNSHEKKDSPEASVTQQNNTITSSTPVLNIDTTDCLRTMYYIVWQKSNYWEEFQKNRKNELCDDIADSETITYVDGIENHKLKVEIVAGDDYIKRAKLNPHVSHTVSWVTLDLKKKEMWSISSGDSVKLKFDTTLLPLIRRKCLKK
jgi:hypothetical protein